MKQRWSWWAGLSVAALTLLGLGAVSARAAESNSQKTWLGVYSQSLSDELRDGMDYSGDGVLVSRVLPGSPAEEAGLKKGDIILSLGGHAVASPEDLARSVRSSRAGQTVALQIWRGGERRALQVKLASRPGSQDEMDFEYTPEAPEAPEAPEPPGGGSNEVRRHIKIHMNRDGKAYDWEGDAPDMPEIPGIIMSGMGRGRLGVRIEGLNSDLGGYFGVPDGKGALIVEVLKDTPAERAGLKAGDVITRAGDHAVYDTGDLVSALRGAERKVTLVVVRKGVRRTVEAELDAAPHAMRFGRGQGMMGFNDDYARQLRELRGHVAGPEDTELREELRQLKDELRALKDEIKGMKHN